MKKLEVFKKVHKIWVIVPGQNSPMSFEPMINESNQTQPKT